MKKILVSVLFLFFPMLQYSCTAQEYGTLEIDDKVRAEAPGEFIKLSDGYVHYEYKDNSEGKVIVLIAGYSVPMYIWDNNFDQLADAGLSVLRFDFYGRGYSDRPDVRHDHELFYRQLSELLTALKVERTVTLVGMSLGGSVAATFADRNPDKVEKIIFIDTEYTSAFEQYPVSYLERLTNLLKDDADNMAEGQLGDLYDPDRFPGYPDKYRPQMLYKGFFRALASTSIFYYREDFTDEFERIGKSDMDFLIIWGKEDNNIPVEISELVMEVIPAAELFIVEKAGHIPHYEKPDTVNKKIIEFMKK
ncbi:alpha/beta fold hydrolase [candidate division KSB1 bacterium]